MREDGLVCEWSGLSFECEPVEGSSWRNIVSVVRVSLLRLCNASCFPKSGDESSAYIRLFVTFVFVHWNQHV